MIEILKNTKLLYVEDDDIIRKQYVCIFKNYFLQVIEASSALEGLEYFENDSFQCIISDIVMNDINGIEFIKEIRKIDKKIPIIICSSHPTQQFLLESIKLELTSFLIKPASFKDIKNALEECSLKMIEEQLLQIKLKDDIYYCPLTKAISSSHHTSILTKKESLLLELLIRNRNKIVDKDAIEYCVYIDQEMSIAALKNLVFKLRKKLSINIITNVPGQGFLLECE